MDLSKPDTMDHSEAYSMKQERVAAERQQAVIRLLLSFVTCGVLVKLYTGQFYVPGYEDIGEKLISSGVDKVTELKLDQVMLLITLFTVYSVVMWALVKYHPETLRITTAVGTLVEFCLITYLFSSTLWTGVPFYLWYFFFVVSVASRYGWLHSILALSASIVSFTYITSVSPQSTASDVVLLLGFTGFLLVLAMMFGQISEKQLNYQASLAVVNDFRAELAGLATSRDITDLLVKRAQELLSAEQAFFLPAKRGADGSEAHGLRSVGADPVLLATFREDGGVWNVEKILESQRPLMSNSLTKHYPVPDGLAQKLGLRNMAAAPMMVRGQPVGVIYAANRKDRGLRSTDLRLLGLVATQAAPVMENALLWERLTEAATSEERLRIARDLHDNFLQTLAAIKLHLERCKILVGKDADRAKEGIDRIHQIATRGLAEVRYYLSELRVMGPEPSRFQEAVKKAAEEASIRGGFKVDAEAKLPDSPLPPGLAMAGFQILRELLNNAVTHSKAEHVKVDVHMDEDRLVLSVEDDGVGFDVDRVRQQKASQGHLGLVGIEERARQCHGTLVINSKPGLGTKAVAWLAV